MNFTIGLNATTLGLAVMFLFIAYFLMIVIANTYTNLTPKDFGKLGIVIYMMGFLTLAIVVGNIIWILFSLGIMGIFLLLLILRIRGKSKSKKKAASSLGGVGGQ